MMLELLRPLSSPALPKIDEDETELRLLKEKILRERGFYRELYKDKCLRRRITVRIRARGQHIYGSYAELLDNDDAGYDRLLDALTINVIIYFDREIQTRIFQRFFDALVPGGYLVLGKVETLLGTSRAMFQPVNARERIFRKPA
jgi:chemotaxis methyl-accepting protein methylase